MTKFKVGDIVQRCGTSWLNVKPGDIHEVERVTSNNSLRLVGLAGWYSVDQFILAPDEELPPAPDSVMYHHRGTYPNYLTAIWDTTFYGGPGVRLTQRTPACGVLLDPDSALQLGYDIIRMARAAKKEQD